jgi:hypothetical protein
VVDKNGRKFVLSVATEVGTSTVRVARDPNAVRKASRDLAVSCDGKQG